MISPQRLTQYRNSWYLDAWCHQAEGLRSFALERIRKQKRVDEAARDVSRRCSRPISISPTDFFRPGRTPGELRFSPETARWIAEENWHPDQQGAFEKDGRWLLKLPFSNRRELIMDVLRYGADVEVLAPDFLREAVAAEATKTSKQYRKCEPVAARWLSHDLRTACVLL